MERRRRTRRPVSITGRMERQWCRSILQITMMVVLLVVQKASASSGKIELADGENDIDTCNGGYINVNMKVTITADEEIEHVRQHAKLHRVLYFIGTSRTPKEIDSTKDSADNKTFVFEFQTEVNATISNVSCIYQLPVNFGGFGGFAECDNLTICRPSTTPRVQPGSVTTKGQVTESSSTKTATVSATFNKTIIEAGSGDELRKQLIKSFPDLKDELNALNKQELAALQEKLQGLNSDNPQEIEDATKEFLESQQQTESGISDLIAGVIAGVVFIVLVVAVTSCYCCKCCCWKTKANPDDSPSNAPSGSTDIQTIESPTDEPTQRKTSSESSKSSADSKYSKAVSIGSSVDGGSNDSGETGSVASWERKFSDDQSDISGSVRSDDSKSTDSSGSSAEGSIRLTYSTTSNVVSLKKI